VITLPHVILEGGAYILAAISGNVISDEIIKDKSEIRNFIFYLFGGACLIVVLKLFFKYAFGLASPVVFSLISVILVTALIHIIITLFQQPRLKKVFVNNYNLFIIAIIIFLIGALVETFVLNYSGTLNKIYALSMMIT
jgi:hypothetical protein